MVPRNSSVAVLVSGGLDSAVLVAEMAELGRTRHLAYLPALFSPQAAPTP